MSSLHVGAAELSGTLRATPEWRGANDRGVLAPAAARLGSGDDVVTTDFELRGAIGPLTGVGTLRHVAAEHRPPEEFGILNELHAGAEVDGWYLTAGKKIVSWDVGYAFRPLDVIQQEDRRRLVSTTLEGIPVLLAERFGADSAWTLVVANPGESPRTFGRDESAAAVRGYWRLGRVDWHAVARHGERTGWRVGAALAFVASESLELHASLLRAERLERLEGVESPQQPVTYIASVAEGGWQALAGVSWTGLNRVSVLLELWRDDGAWTREDWSEWQSATRRLNEIALPTALREGAVATQAGALGMNSLHRDNALIRVAYAGDAFYPSADMLYTPADGGVIATARLVWRGGRTEVEAGWRACFGPILRSRGSCPSRTSHFFRQV